MVGIGSIRRGNHGAEPLLRGASKATVDLRPSAAGRVRGVADGVRADRMREAGLLREDKGPIVALHWRGADDEERAEDLAREIAESAREVGLVIHEGRRVLELRRRSRSARTRRSGDGSRSRPSASRSTSATT